MFCFVDIETFCKKQKQMFGYVGVYCLISGTLRRVLGGGVEED